MDEIVLRLKITSFPAKAGIQTQQLKQKLPKTALNYPLLKLLYLS